MHNAIEVTDLIKVYKTGTRAIDGISFHVARGEIFGLLGPNGAGKSTTIKILIGLLNPTAGELRINGVDIRAHPAEIKRATGYAAQETAIDDRLTGWENITLQGRFYHLPGREIRDRATEMLKMFNLYDRRKDLTATYSGGMLKRLDIACALIHRPQILFLDEPTLGLDVQTRQMIWDYIERLRTEYEMTIFITTHYMEEADALCDRLAIIDQGKIVALDTPDTLKASLGGDIISLRCSEMDGKEERMIARIAEVPHVQSVEPVKDGWYRVIVEREGERLIPHLFSLCSTAGVTIEEVSLKKPSLDDVYLHFTGRAMRDAEENREAHMKARFMRSKARRKG